MTLTLHLEKCPVNASVKASKQSACTSILIQDLPLLLFTKAKHHRLGGADVPRGIISGGNIHQSSNLFQA